MGYDENQYIQCRYIDVEHIFLGSSVLTGAAVEV